MQPGLADLLTDVSFPRGMRREGAVGEGDGEARVHDEGGDEER